MRLTKIICTLGPSSATPEMLPKLASAGMNIARINFSHGKASDHQRTIQMVKDLNSKHGLNIAILLDTKGAEIRTGDVETPIEVKSGEEVVFSSVPLEGETRPVIMVNYKEFGDDVKKAEKILVENGALPFEIVSIRDDGSVIARAEDDGSIGSRRHVNLPGADISLPTMTQKDWDDLKVGIDEKMDYVALSFIRTGNEVRDVRTFLGKNGSEMGIIAKIETRQSVANIDDIIEASDGIMVARGDLGAEMPFERIPAVQDMIVEKCRRAGKPVIVATQMLESMIEHPMPTRAEVTDIAHAASSRADSTMLSGETAAGQHPLASVKAMSLVLEETESLQTPEMSRPARCELGERCALAEAAVGMAKSFESPVILVITRSGKTAQAVSMLRPQVPIVACTPTNEACRMLQLWHGVIPVNLPFDTDPEVTLHHAMEELKKMEFVRPESRIVVVSDATSKSGVKRAVYLSTLQ